MGATTRRRSRRDPLLTKVSTTKRDGSGYRSSVPALILYAAGVTDEDVRAGRVYLRWPERPGRRGSTLVFPVVVELIREEVVRREDSA